MLGRLWHRWKRIAHAIGMFQSRLLMTVFYALLIIPIGAIARLCSDPLHLRRRKTASYWEARASGVETLSQAGNEF